MENNERHQELVTTLDYKVTIPEPSLSYQLRHIVSPIPVLRPRSVGTKVTTKTVHEHHTRTLSMVYGLKESNE